MIKRATLVLLSLLICAGCRRSDVRETPAQAYLNWKDKFAVATGLPLFGYHPCAHWVEYKMGGYYESVPEDRCVKFDPPRRFQGLWRNDFEGTQFCPAPARECSYVSTERRKQPLIWLDFSFRLPDPAEGPFGGLYSVDFIGRTSAYGGAYGHFGMFDEQVIVDRLISIQELEPPPKPAKK